MKHLLSAWLLGELHHFASVTKGDLHIKTEGIDGLVDRGERIRDRHITKITKWFDAVLTNQTTTIFHSIEPFHPEAPLERRHIAYFYIRLLC